MEFKVLPVIDTMSALYRKPLDMQRFEDYLKLLEGGTKGELKFPVSFFNPMAKGHVLQKLDELKQMGAEEIMTNVATALNDKFKSEHDTPAIHIALNLADDLMGGWTNRYITDYDSKFEINAYVNRHFCLPVFWAGEGLSPEIIESRTKEYACRTIYWLNHRKKPLYLADYIAQEKFVAENAGHHLSPATDISFLENCYQARHTSEDYATIFNFFYGDAASQSLGYPSYGIKDEMAGFKFADHLAKKAL